jgi:hypothetical protein
VDKREAIETLIRGEGWISLASVEHVLRRETSCVAPEDVVLLMQALYESAETDLPTELQAEIDRRMKEIDGEDADYDPDFGDDE